VETEGGLEQRAGYVCERAGLDIKQFDRRTRNTSLAASAGIK
jgi:hypothetical protein